MIDLRAVYDPVLAEPIPQRFIELLDAIDRAAEERGECSGGPDGSTKARESGSK